MKFKTPLSVVLGLHSALALFSAPPDAGQLLREQQSQAERKLPQLPPSADIPVSSQPAPKASGATVFVKEVHFTGNEGLASLDELQALAKNVTGKNASAAELQGLADKVTAALRTKGYFLARAYLPKQDVTGGVIQVAIIQARSDGEVVINPSEGVRVRERQLKQMVDAIIKPGQPLQERDLERVLLLMNDLPGVSAKAVLAPGAQPGTTRITLNVSEAKLFSGAFWADNYGNRYTGAARGNGLVSINDPFRIGDQFNVMFSGAEGLAQGRVAYTAPIGARGLEASASYTAMSYKLIGDLSSLEAKGTAETMNAGLGYPLIRRRFFNLNANASYEGKRLIDKVQGSTVRDKQIHSGTFGFTGDLSDKFNGGGYTSWSASASMGKLDLSNNPVDEFFDRIGPKAAGNFQKYNLSASRLQRVTNRLTFSGSYFGQFASGNLDSSEKFNLGGPYGVRAYAVGEASGDEGHLFNLELREDLPLDLKWGNLQAIGFFDTGNITLHHSKWPNAINTATRKNNYWLSGAGVGLVLSKPGLYSLRVSYAHKIGENDGRSADIKEFFGNVVSPGGKDADGHESDGRVWLMGQVMF
jgi:hemolysin activation/secretion protein